MHIEQRLARLEAIEAIRCLKARYFQACDAKQPERVRDCFAAGSIDLQFGRIGSFTDRDQLVQVFSQLACQEHIIEMHHGQNPQIEIIREDAAEASWGLYYYMIDTRRQLLTQLAGVYDDGYALIDGRWRIVKSHYRVTSTQIFDLNEGLARLIFAGAEAPRELDDPQQQGG